MEITGRQDRLEEGWNCGVCHGIGTICEVKGRRWCRNCQGREKLPNHRGTGERRENGGAINEAPEWEPHDHLMGPALQATVQKDNLGHGGGEKRERQRQAEAAERAPKQVSINPQPIIMAGIERGTMQQSTDVRETGELGTGGLGMAEPRGDTGTVVKAGIAAGGTDHSGTGIHLEVTPQSTSGQGNSTPIRAFSQLGMGTPNRNSSVETECSHGTGTWMGEQRIWAANRQMALAAIKGNAGIPFRGKSREEYQNWKAGMEMDLAGLEPTAADWLCLLTIRTTGEARRAVDRAKQVGYTDPRETVQCIWDEFEEDFGLQPSAASSVLKQLQEYEEVSEKNREGLREFKAICRQAVRLASTEEGRR